MNEQDEAAGRQRLQALEQYQKKLVVYATNRDVIHPTGGEHETAVKDYDKVAGIVGRLEADPLIPAVRIVDAELAVASAETEKAAAEVALTTHTAEAAEQLATHQGAVSAATDKVTEAQDALDDLVNP